MDWVALIQNVGITGAMCVGMLIYINKLIDKDREENKEFIQALANNTNAIEQLKLLINQLIYRNGKED